MHICDIWSYEHIPSSGSVFVVTIDVVVVTQYNDSDRFFFRTNIIVNNHISIFYDEGLIFSGIAIHIWKYIISFDIFDFVIYTSYSFTISVFLLTIHIFNSSQSIFTNGSSLVTQGDESHIVFVGGDHFSLPLCTSDDTYSVKNFSFSKIDNGGIFRIIVGREIVATLATINRIRNHHGTHRISSSILHNTQSWCIRFEHSTLCFTG